LSAGRLVQQQQPRQRQCLPQGQCSAFAFAVLAGGAAKSTVGAQSGVAISIAIQALTTNQRMGVQAYFMALMNYTSKRRQQVQRKITYFSQNMF
jgi:hypothetical protein